MGEKQIRKKVGKKILFKKKSEALEGQWCL